MDCKEERDLIVFPVFYKVEPREVRTPRQKYREAMLKHESKFGKDSKEVKRWKKALSDAGSLFGWDLKDGDESKLIQRIVTEISTHLDRKPLYVAKHPVGIDSQVVKLKSMLNLESDDDVLMVELWGQGGVGKTALAKAVYNDIFRKFRNSCFLANVREVSKDCKDLVTLQETLLFEMLALKERLVVSSVDKGIKLIQDRLCRKKVLLILDDVDDLHQLNALAGDVKWFGNGSRVIITTRNKHLLIGHGIDLHRVYEVKELDDGLAHELFSKHAFLTNQKLKIKTDLVDSVLNHAKGLPLALEVLGSFLRGRREDEWESTLYKISTVPKKEINDVLKISYDGLEANEKEIFLHIACFFKGWKTRYIEKVLHSCDLETVIGLRTLMERSLIRIESQNIHMHDLIQLMGMDIVNQESDDPGRRSRLWLYKDVLDVLSSDMGDCAVKAIVLEPPEPIEICIDPDAFTKMRRLKLLLVRNVHNSIQGPICLPNELRWFLWDGSTPQIPKFSFGRKKLVGLDMSNCSITVMPQQFKDFPNMKFINFSECESVVSLPDLSCTPNLEELNIENCRNLGEVHESIAYHDKLQVLTLKGCSELSVFPNVLKSKNLQALHLENCTKLERFPNIPQKLDLKKLALRGIAIKELPTSIENLVFLEKLDVVDCKNLVSIPSSIYKLKNIEELELEGCTKLNGFPKYEDSVDLHMKIGLSKMHHLRLVGCNLSEVEFLENLSCFPFLAWLNLRGNKITNLPTSINKRDCLTSLVVEDCHQLQEIPELPPFLNSFSAENCPLIKIGDLISSHDFVRRGLTVAPISSRHQDISQINVFLPGGEMPEWVIPIEGRCMSFLISEDLYDKFLGFALCVVVGKDEQKEGGFIRVEVGVNGEKRPAFGLTGFALSFQTLDLDHFWLKYFVPSWPWRVVDFGKIDGGYAQLSFTVSCKTMKKCGFRIICKQLEDRLKVEIRDNQLINLAFLYEVGHDSIDPKAKSSYMHKGSPIEIDLLENSQHCQMRTEEHDQMGSKRNQQLILTRGMRTNTMSTSNSTGRDESGDVGLQLLLLE